MMEGADVYIGLSAPGIVSREMVKSMAKGAIVFALANPIPEIMPDQFLTFFEPEFSAIVIPP